jgi:hypothetical protein
MSHQHILQRLTFTYWEIAQVQVGALAVGDTRDGLSKLPKHSMNLTGSISTIGGEGGGSNQWLDDLANPTLDASPNTRSFTLL